MSRKWKPLPTHLPGWHRNASPLYEAKPKARNVRLRKPHRKFKNPKPTKHLVLAITLLANPSIHHSYWSRLRGTWHCTRSQYPFHWFTSASPKAVSHYLNQHSISYQWLSPHLQTAELSPAPCSQTTTSSDVGNTPASAVRSNVNKNKNPHTLTALLRGSVDSLERNGDESPVRLIDTGSPALPQNY